MSQRLINGFVGGCLGALVLVIIMYIMLAVNGAVPPFVGMYRGTFGTNAASDQFIATILFIISGGVWGLLYGLLVKRSTIGSAMLFGFLPTLWLLIAVNAFLGKPLFNGFTPMGIIMPVIFNVVIWGFVLGWYMRNKSVHAKAVTAV